jgi:hypothetical protein
MSEKLILIIEISHIGEQKTPNFYYKDQCCLFWESYEIHKYTNG